MSASGPRSSGERGSGAPGSVPPAAESAGEVARLVSYVVLLLVAITLYVRAGALPTSRWEPLGAGAFPKLVMAMLAALCVGAIVLSVRRLALTGMPGGWAARSRDWLRRHRLVICAFLLLAGYLLLLRPLGFNIATFLFLLAGQLIIAPRSRSALVAAPIVALVFSFGLDRLFAEVFLVFLPAGPFG